MHRFFSQVVKRHPNNPKKRSAATQVIQTSPLAGYERRCVGRQSILQRAFSAHAGGQYPPFDRTSLQGEFGAYSEEYDRSLKEPEAFWGQAAKGIHWFESPTKILRQDPDKPHSYQWFSDGTTNTAYNCLDVQVDAGHGDRTALIYDSPVTGVQKHISYKELLDQVSVFAGALKDELSVEPGDRVVIYMPMIPEAIVAMVRSHSRKHLVRFWICREPQLFSCSLVSELLLVFSWPVQGLVLSTPWSLEDSHQLNWPLESQIVSQRSLFQLRRG